MHPFSRQKRSQTSSLFEFIYETESPVSLENSRGCGVRITVRFAFFIAEIPSPPIEERAFIASASSIIGAPSVFRSASVSESKPSVFPEPEPIRQEVCLSERESASDISASVIEEIDITPLYITSGYFKTSSSHSDLSPKNDTSPTPPRSAASRERYAAPRYFSLPVIIKVLPKVPLFEFFALIGNTSVAHASSVR